MDYATLRRYLINSIADKTNLTVVDMLDMSMDDLIELGQSVGVTTRKSDRQLQGHGRIVIEDTRPDHWRHSGSISQID